MKPIMAQLVFWITTNLLKIILVIIILTTTTSMLVRTCSLQEDNHRLKYNATVSDIQTKIWTNKYGQVVAENYAKQLTKQEIINSQNEDISKLKTKVVNSGVKIKNLEYMLSVNLGLDIDSIVPIFTDTIHDSINTTIIERVDSISKGDFHLKRIEIFGSNKSEYSISYNPELYIAISHYKDGKWRLRNLFTRRDIRYKATVTTSDDLLKPRKIVIVKKD